MLKPHHANDLRFLGFFHLLLGSLWCFATMRLRSISLCYLSLPRSLNSLGVPLRAALGVVLLSVPAQTPS